MAKKDKPATKRKDSSTNVLVKQNKFFNEVPYPTLSVKKIPVDDLYSIFNAKDKKNSNDFEITQKFIEINKQAFEFLDINVKAYSKGEIEYGIELTTGQFAGSIPIRSPFNGKYQVDLNVACGYSPRVTNDDIFALLLNMGELLITEFDDNLKLISNYSRPPLYFECQKFIDTYIKARKINWSKFINEIRIESNPRGNTDWSKYALTYHDPKSRLLFRNRINRQSVIHPGWRELNYVLGICIGELTSSKVPGPLLAAYKKKIALIRTFPEVNLVQSTRHISSQPNDPVVIKKLKSLANVILDRRTDSNFAWRLNVAIFYERYVQFLLNQATRPYGWLISSNPKYFINGFHSSWTLKYLEPDIILDKKDVQIVVDAKYKAHMGANLNSDTPVLKESFRADLHQVLAYSAFNSMQNKIVILIYPNFKSDSDTQETSQADQNLIFARDQEIRNPFNGRTIIVKLLGIPIVNRKLPQLKAELKGIIACFS